MARYSHFSPILIILERSAKKEIRPSKTCDASAKIGNFLVKS